MDNLRLALNDILFCQARLGGLWYAPPTYSPILIFSMH